MILWRLRFILASVPELTSDLSGPWPGLAAWDGVRHLHVGWYTTWRHTLCICITSTVHRGGLGGLTPPPLQRLVFSFFCLSVYENSLGPGP